MAVLGANGAPEDALRGDARMHVNTTYHRHDEYITRGNQSAEYCSAGEVYTPMMRDKY